MLHILWMIVKFLLITVGVILGLILLLLLLLLFCPFVYQGSGGKHGKDFSGQAKVSWLFRAIAVVVDFGYKKDVEIDLCLFGISLRKLKKKREQRKQEKQRKAREKAKAEARKKKKKEEKQIPVESEKNEPKQIPVMSESEMPDVTADDTEDGSEKLRTADMAVSAEQVVTEKTVEEQPIEEQEQTESEIPIVTAEELLENSVIKEPEPVEENPVVHDETPVEVIPAEADRSVISEEAGTTDRSNQPSEPDQSTEPEKSSEPSESEETPSPGKKQKRNLLDLLSKAIGAVFTLPFVAVRKICRFLSSIFGKIRSVFEKVTGKVRGIRDKVDQLLEKAKTWKRFLTDERTLGALKLVKDELFRLLRHIMPRKLYGNVAFGLEDPSAMGAVLAVLGATIPIHKNCIEIEPVFEQNYFEGEIGLKGRIYVCVIVWSALKILINKNIHYVYRVLRKKEAM